VVGLRWVNSDSFVLGADVALQGGLCAVELGAVLVRTVVANYQVLRASSAALRGQEKTLLFRFRNRLKELEHDALLVLRFLHLRAQLLLRSSQPSVLLLRFGIGLR
jgi:hypothetical protein